MSTRATSLQATNVLAINREIDSKYDAVLAVRDKLVEIEKVAGLDVEQLLTDLQNAQDFTGISVVAGETAGWDAETKTITVPTLKGDQGTQGPVGATGATGATGAKGDRGLTGAAGVNGKDGKDGTNGTDGINGRDGIDGKDLTIEQISYNSSTGRFMWQFSDGTSYETPDLRGAKGATGDKGDKGDQGISVHHIKRTSTTDSEGDFGSSGKVDTYTVYGDAAETLNLGTFTVKSGVDVVVWDDIPNKPTTLAGYGIVDADTSLQVTTKINEAVANLVNAAPATLDTLNELASALGNDANFATTVTNGLATRVTKNADIVAGTGTKITYDAKGLITSSTTLTASDIPVLDTSKLTTGTLPVVRGGTGTTTSTGAGNIVLSNSPTLVTPNIGTATGTSFNSITGLSSTTPVVAGTAAVGVSTTTARADHVHPAQTTITGNAGTATALATGRTIGMTGDVTWTSASFDGTGNVTGVSTLKNTGTAGTYRSVTTDAQGRVTSGTNPTTVAEYGLTDVYTKTEIQTVLPKIGFDNTNVTAPSVAGQVAWNSTENTLDIALSGAVLQVGQEQLIRVRNNTASAITNGSAVMATGTLGASGRITVAPANITQANPKYFLGVITETIAAGADGFCTTFGKVRAIQTDGGNYGEAWVDGDVLYVKDSGSGALTNIVPTSTQVKMPIAMVINSHATNGTLFIRATPVDENHANTDLLLKADKTYVDGLIGDINSALDTINGVVI